MNNIKKHAIWMKMGYKIQFHDVGIIFDLIFRVAFRYIFLSFLWSSIFQNNSIAGWTDESYRIYIGASTFLSSISSYPNIYFMSMDMKSGNIINYLEKPMYYPYQVIYKNMGICISNVLILAPVFIIYMFISGTSLVGENVLWFIILSILGVITYILFDVLLGLLTFWTENSWGLTLLEGTIFMFFSGRMLPLDFFPEQLGRALRLSPFSGMIYEPVMILINGMGERGHFIIIQLIWILVFYMLIRFVFSKCRNNITIYGG
mgnify:FL=1|jgi:ABC-2 type transport system permease protein